MKAAGLRHATLEREGRETGEVVLVIPNKEFREIFDAVEAGVKANPRKRSWRRALELLEEVAAWGL